MSYRVEDRRYPAPYVLNSTEIRRAAMILAGMAQARKSEARGAFGLETPDGHKEMIDEPMVKQVGYLERVSSSSLSTRHCRLHQ